MTSDEYSAPGAPADVVLFRASDGSTKLEVRLQDETVWLSQAQMADLFQSSKQNVSLHIANVFEDGELVADAVVKEYLTTAADGKSYRVKHYNLDVIISVGYRVRSLRGTQFRQWATSVLREYVVKGFTMNDDLLKAAGGGSYWRELLERIRDIRSSEKVLYRQVLDLYATSVDYDPAAAESRAFFKIVQNKLHYAAHGHTAAELVADRADAAKPFMGLTTFAGEQPKRSEVSVAKNYLTETELATLNRMVSAYFDLAELRAMRKQPMHMKDWISELDDFSERYGEGVLGDAGSISQKEAKRRAELEFETYRERTLEEPSRAERDYLASLKATEKRIAPTVKDSDR